jgi:6-phosphogluconolactonase (cycloisomerase 2 family)
MTFSKIGRMVTALVASAALGLGMTACGGGTIGYMWIVGTYYNQISGFLIDDYTGNLGAIAHTPFSSGGSNPAMIVVKPAGRYIYVINSGTGATGTPGKPSFNSPGASIAQFSVGSGGILTFQQNYSSQGVQPVWAAIDSSGNYLYVVDKYSPDYATTGLGSITAFSIASDTGRLTLVTNSTILSNGLPQSWFDVGANPIMAKFGPGGCLYTLSPNSIFPYAQSASNGQLTVPTTGPYQVAGSNNLSSINAGGAGGYIYLTDAGANQIFSLQSGGGACSLTQIAGSQQTNLPGTLNPMNSITSSSGKFLYVLNSSVTGAGVPVTNANSSISAFTINSSGQLQTLSDTTNNPYAVGSGPLCVGQDPSNQYLFISNYVDSTVTGKLIDQNRGYLSNLQRGSVFPVTMHPTCLVISGNL